MEDSLQYYLGHIKYRPNTVWFEVYKLILAKDIDSAEKKLRVWAEKSIADKNVVIIVTETL
jgi:hypothetical protein